VRLGRTRAVPGEGPHVGGAGLQPAGVASLCCAEGAGEGGAGVDGAKAGGAGGPPGRAVRCEAPTGPQGMAGRGGLQGPAPRRPATGNTRARWPEATRGCGEPLAGCSRGVDHGVGRAPWRRAAQGAEGLGDGTGAEAGRSGQLVLQVGLEPLLGVMRRTVGTGAVATGLLEAGWRATPLARREAVALGPAVARWEGPQDGAVRQGPMGGARQGCGRNGGAESAQGGHGRRPGRRALRRS
jgi:hypothetical protein